MPHTLHTAPRLAAVALIAIAVIATAAACGSSSSNKATTTIEVATPRPTTPAAPGATGTLTPGGGPAAPGAPITVTTSGTTLAFSPTQITVNAGQQVTVQYNNNSPLPHNIHFFNGKDASAPSLAQTDIATGPNAVHTTTFTAPAAGTYFYHCDVHPTQMTGQLIVK